MNAAARIDTTLRPERRRGARRQHPERQARAPRARQRRRPLVLRARSGHHHPGRICADAPLPRRAGRRRTRAQDRAFICAALRATHGGWPLFQDGDFDISASVKAYFALKMIGDDVDAPHMKRAREAILAHGGAATLQCVHALAAGALWRNPVARRAGDAGRNHAAAEDGFPSISTRFPIGAAPCSCRCSC